MNKKITNLEWLKQNFKECLSDGYTPPCRCIYMAENGCDCINVLCKNCEYNSFYKILDYLSQEHKEPIKLKQWEYDLIDIYCNCHNWCNMKLKDTTFIIMKDKGYFKGVTDTSMTIREILNNCEIVSDDYEGFEDCK